MLGRNIKVGTVINGRPVVRVSSGHATFYVKRSPFTAPARFVWFAGESRSVAFEADRPVAGAAGYAESLPAGGVASKHVRTPDKVRASTNKWRGEQVHGMPTRHHDMIARTNMFDHGRVNGVVGTRPGAGTVEQTGGSF